MRCVDYTLENSYAVSVPALGNTTLYIDIPNDEKIHAIDVCLVFDSGDTWSKDITFRLSKEIGFDTEDYAFWDDSNLTVFSDMLKLLNKGDYQLQIYILNNDAVNAIVVDRLFIRFYLYD